MIVAVAVAAVDDGGAAAVGDQKDCSFGTGVAFDGQMQTYPSLRQYVVHPMTVPKTEVFPGPCPCPSREYEGRQPDCGTAYSFLQELGYSSLAVGSRSWRMRTNSDLGERV